jgi:hypothetical protein
MPGRIGPFRTIILSIIESNFIESNECSRRTLVGHPGKFGRK